MTTMQIETEPKQLKILKLPRRFALQRLTDQTGVSGTGLVLSGVLLESGKVVVEWRSPYQTMGIYNSLEEFTKIHVDCHPDMNRVIWYDQDPWHCFDCGAGGMDGNFCGLCGSPSMGFHSAHEGFVDSPQRQAEMELEKLNRKMQDALTHEESRRRHELVSIIRKETK